MTLAFQYLLEHAPSLAEFRRSGQDTYDVLRSMALRMGTASSGEKCMIAAAISFAPTGQLPEGVDVPAFQLSNTAALVGAIALAADHTEVLHNWR